MKLLDLFCCCGGISKGFHDAGWECTGVDIKDGHQYPYKFIQSDVFNLPLSFFKQFDIIHASPPCQHYFYGINEKHRQDFPDLVERTRHLLNCVRDLYGVKYMMENIPGAPLRKDLVLCGEMFGLRVIRHRIFELHGFTIMQPPHIKHKQPIDKTHSYYAQVAGHGGNSYSFKIEDHQKAMGIDWVDKKEHLTQMIPPKYAEYIASYVK